MAKIKKKLGKKKEEAKPKTKPKRSTGEPKRNQVPPSHIAEDEILQTSIMKQVSVLFVVCSTLFRKLAVG